MIPGLHLDLQGLRDGFFFRCKTCDDKNHFEDLCVKCKIVEQYEMDTYMLRASSIVVIPPKLFSFLFNMTGPVPYFEVVAAYMYAMDALYEGYCNPNSGFLASNSEWFETNYDVRLSAKEVLNHYEAEKRDVLKKMREMQCHDENMYRAQVLRGLEQILLFVIVVMQKVSVKDAIELPFDEFVDDVKATVKDVQGGLFTCSVISWPEKCIRCACDDTEIQYERNKTWNELRVRNFA